MERASIAAGPAVLPVKSLLCHGAEYHPQKIDLYRRLMDAHEFNEHRNLYMPKLATEEGPDGEARYRRRVANATYTSHIGSLLWFLARATFCSAPAIIPTTGDAEEKGDEDSDAGTEDEAPTGTPGPADDYWSSLNRNADGAKHNLTETLVRLLVEGLTQGRAYLSLAFPDDDGDGNQEVAFTNLATQKASGAGDARMAVIPAVQIIRWQTDDAGNLEYVLRHIEEEERASIFDPPIGIRHTWTFITAEFIQEYTSLQPLVNGRPDTLWSEKGAAESRPIKIHSTGVVPLIPLAVPHVVRQLADEALSLFRTESQHDWYLHGSAFSQPVISSDKAFEAGGKIVNASDFAIVLETSGHAGFISPDAAHNQSFVSREDTKLNNLYMALQSLSLQTPSLKSGPRQSGDAKTLDLGQLQTVCESFANAVLDCLTTWVSAVKTVRAEESAGVAITGLDHCDVEGLGAKLTFAESFIKLPVAESAKRYVLTDLATSAAASAPPEIKQAIVREMAEMDLEDKPAPVPPQLREFTGGETDEGTENGDSAAGDSVGGNDAAERGTEPVRAAK